MKDCFHVSVTCHPVKSYLTCLSAFMHSFSLCFRRSFDRIVGFVLVCFSQSLQCTYMPFTILHLQLLQESSFEDDDHSMFYRKRMNGGKKKSPGQIWPFLASLTECTPTLCATAETASVCLSPATVGPVFIHPWFLLPHNLLFGS